jgi:hypothetical protein
MISKNLARRLERLEDRLLPTNEDPLVFVIIGVDPDGQKAEHCRFTVHIPQRPPKERFR